MKRLIRSNVLVGLVVLAGAGGASAQNGGGLGGLLDWLHKLSGPQFVGGGVTAYYTLPGEAGVRLRATGVFRTSVSERGEVVPADANITMITLQPTVEVPLPGIPVDLGAGVAFHRFGGDADGFWHYSFPLQAQLRPRWNSRWLPRVGVGLHIFPSFGADDFAPLAVDVSRDNPEAVLQLFIGLDYRP